jgi:hypothetical protein
VRGLCGPSLRERHHAYPFYVEAQAADDPGDDAEDSPEIDPEPYETAYCQELESEEEEGGD